MPKDKEGCCQWGKGHRKVKCENECYTLYSFGNSQTGHPPTSTFSQCPVEEMARKVKFKQNLSVKHNSPQFALQTTQQDVVLESSWMAISPW